MKNAEENSGIFFFAWVEIKMQCSFQLVEKRKRLWFGSGSGESRGH
jgi:hypothetical protein